MIDGISQFGTLLLLLLTGMETDLKLMRASGRAAISISLAGVAVPFACGAMLGALMPESLLPGPDKRLLTALFLGTALSISSDQDRCRHRAGDELHAARPRSDHRLFRHHGDTIGWIIIAITFSLATAARIDLAEVARSVAGSCCLLSLGKFDARPSRAACSAFGLGVRVWTHSGFKERVRFLTQGGSIVSQAVSQTAIETLIHRFALCLKLSANEGE